MRKTCWSGKTSLTAALRIRAEGRSTPNGFSMMIRARSTRAASRRVVTTVVAAEGGTLR